ncbi:hypothetical protein L1887_32153 [Cichorium endivia]|nr:hypothetical protein L1887_32153 [Cichorium endivia]
MEKATTSLYPVAPMVYAMVFNLIQGSLITSPYLSAARGRRSRSTNVDSASDKRDWHGGRLLSDTTFSIKSQNPDDIQDLIKIDKSKSMEIYMNMKKSRPVSNFNRLLSGHILESQAILKADVHWWPTAEAALDGDDLGAGWRKLPLSLSHALHTSQKSLGSVSKEKMNIGKVICDYVHVL